MNGMARYGLAGLLSLAGAIAQAAVFTETFSANPLEHGWVSMGASSLFHWDEAAGVLQVTWDSAQPNSYFCRALGSEVTTADDFELAFDLALQDIEVGTTAGKPYTFQIAVGLVNLQGATAPGFLRGTGFSSPNLVEFDYFPDSGFGATVSPTLISTNHQFASGFTFPLELTPGHTFRATMRYTAANRTLTTSLTKDGQPYGKVDDVALGASFSDIRVDHVAVLSYSDEGQDPPFAGSVRAHGWVDNIALTLPDVPVTTVAGTYAGGRFVMPLPGLPGWQYTLQRTTDFLKWDNAAGPIDGIGERQVIIDEAPPRERAFYRLQAVKR